MKVYIVLNVVAAVGVGVVLWMIYSSPTERRPYIPVFQGILDSHSAQRFPEEHCKDLVRLYGDNALKPCLDRAVASWHETIQTRYKLSAKEWAGVMDECYSKFSIRECENPATFEVVAHAHYQNRLKE